eukprot:350264-Chlamydomonas_euryale.AAC.4
MGCSDQRRGMVCVWGGITTQDGSASASLNGSDGVSPLIPHLNDRQVRKGKGGTRAGWCTPRGVL